jgi:hypothetical protein
LHAEVAEIGICHCEMCRRWGSGSWLALQAPDSEIVGDSLIVHRSSSFAEWGFCGACGTHIFHRPHGGPEMAVSVGLFDDGGRRIAREMFVDRKPGYLRYDTDAEKIGTARDSALGAKTALETSWSTLGMAKSPAEIMNPDRCAPSAPVVVRRDR